ncbi:MAG: GIY-YIG nuclease family protein, partial [Nitrospinae bacterium]|nr:GIY-YIG nuclease family protein [Nitrospinota bacterium]
MESNPQSIPWHIYMIRTSHGQLYTGITQNVARRFREHQEGGQKAAKFLRGKGPLKLVFQQEVGNKSSALKAEIAIKQLPKKQKESLTKISGGLNLNDLKLVQRKQSEFT